MFSFSSSPSPKYRSPRTSAKGNIGFTILEMLVAMAVMVLMVLLLANMVGSVSSTWINGKGRTENFTKARALMDLFAKDIQSGLFRDDLAAFPGSLAAFYTLRQGVPASGSAPRSISLVEYRLDPSSADPTLRRGDLAIAWDAAAGAVSFGNTSALPQLSAVTLREMAPGVVGFKLVFLYADGSVSPSFAPTAQNPVRAVAITLAVIDERSLGRLNDSQRADLMQDLADAAGGTGSTRKDWEIYLGTAPLPPDVLRGIKVFERYVSPPGNL